MHLYLFGCAGEVAESQLKLVGLYSDDAEVVPQSNSKLATWEEDLVGHLVKVEEAKKVSYTCMQLRTCTASLRDE